MMFFSKEELQKEIDLKYINVQKHKNYDLYIYNYSQYAQFDQHWNEITMNCRGLILDGDFNIVARPFKKFFNFEEMEERLPNEEWEATKKLDGSMFIVCLYKHFIITATRGSFNSNQAILGRKILKEKYLDRGINPFVEGITYIFELVGSSNKIVIDYPENDIILLATVNNETGIDETAPQIGFQAVSFFKSGKTLKELFDLKSLNISNEEGFVIKFNPSGTRIKIKFEEYIRLHKILTGISTKSIWETLMNDGKFDEILEKVPDEFHNWVDKTIKALKYQYGQVWSNAGWYYDYIITEQNDLYSDKFQTKKEIALYIQDSVPKEFRSIVFNMIDGKEYKHLIWKLVRPKYEQPFKTNSEEKNLI